MAERRSQLSIATRIFAVQVLAAVVLSLALTAVLWFDARAAANDNASRVSLAVSNILAHDPFVIEAVQLQDPTEELQPYAVDVMDDADVDFVTIMSPDGIRFTHPDPQQIGKQFLGTIENAQRGETITETFTGTLGPSVRAVVPILDDGRIVAIVSAGVTVASVGELLTPRIPFVLGIAAILVTIGSAGAFVARRYLSKVTGRMRPSELARMVGYYESVLHSVREGLILVDNDYRVVLYNDEAADLLDLEPANTLVEPVPVTELGLPESLERLLVEGGRAVEETHTAGNRVLLVNQEPAQAPASSPTSGALGTVTTLRDRTELKSLVGELESVRTLSDALRSQTHEFANRLHTVLSLLELGRAPEAIELIADEVTLSQSRADQVMGVIGEPVLAALLLGKTSQASERGVELQLDIAEPTESAAIPPTELVSVLGNLIDNAMDAALDGPTPAWVRVSLRSDDGFVEYRVSDSGPGVVSTNTDAIFTRGFSTKPEEQAGRGFGLALVREIVQRRSGTIELRQENGTEFVVRLPSRDREPA